MNLIRKAFTAIRLHWRTLRLQLALLYAGAFFGSVLVLSLFAVHSRSQLWVIYLVAFGYGVAFSVLGSGFAGLQKDLLPGPLAPLGRILASRIGRSPVPLPALVPLLPLQFVHEDDLGQALLRCVLGAGPPGAYNIAADGILSTADVAREFGLIPLPLPAGPARLAARAVAALPFLPPAAQWVEAASHPAIMDTTKAKQDLGWTPRFTALEALRDTLRPRPAGR